MIFSKQIPLVNVMSFVSFPGDHFSDENTSKSDLRRGHALSNKSNTAWKGKVRESTKNRKKVRYQWQHSLRSWRRVSVDAVNSVQPATTPHPPSPRTIILSQAPVSHLPPVQNGPRERCLPHRRWPPATQASGNNVLHGNEATVLVHTKVSRSLTWTE